MKLHGFVSIFSNIFLGVTPLDPITGEGRGLQDLGEHSLSQFFRDSTAAAYDTIGRSLFKIRIFTQIAWNCTDLYLYFTPLDPITGEGRGLQDLSEHSLSQFFRDSTAAAYDTFNWAAVLCRYMAYQMRSLALVPCWMQLLHEWHVGISYDPSAFPVTRSSTFMYSTYC